MKVAIIILNYNSSDDCRKCVSLLKKQENINFEIVIVDNCSIIEDIKLIELLSTTEDCTLIKSPKNRGYSAGNNIGLRYAADKGYEYALIINPDVEVHDTNYLFSLLHKFQSDENIVVIGSDIINVEGLHQNPLREVSYFEELFWFLEFIRNKISKNKYYVTDWIKNGYCKKLSGCCFMIKISFLEQIGFLDEGTFLYCEEAILAKQVELSDKTMYYFADAQAIHAHIKTQKGNKYKRLNLFVQSRIYYLKEYSGYSNVALIFLVLSKKFYLYICNKFLIK